MTDLKKYVDVTSRARNKAGEDCCADNAAAILSLDARVAGIETDVSGILPAVTAAAQVSIAAKIAAQEAQEAAEAAAGSAASSAADLQSALGRFLQPAAADPTARDNGGALQLGDQYLNTTTDEPRVYGSDGWFTPGGSGRPYYDVGAFVPGPLPPDFTTLVEFAVPRDVVFLTDLPGAVFFLSVPPTSVDVELKVLYRPAMGAEVQMGLVHIDPAGSVTVDTAQTSVFAGDRVAIVSYVDPTETAVGDLTLTLRAEIL